MSLRRMEEFHTEPAHVRKIQAAKFGMKKYAFPSTMIVVGLLCMLLAYGILAAVAAFYQTPENLYLQGGAMVGHLGLMFFTFLMALIVVPVLFPLQLLFIAAFVALVPAVLYLSKAVVYFVRKGFNKPVSAQRSVRIVRRVRMA